MLALAPEEIAARQPLIIVSYHIPLLSETPDRGAFMDMLREAANRAGITYRVDFYPPKRAVDLFLNHEVTALIPALQPEILAHAALTDPIFRKNIHALVRHGSPIPADIPQLQGLRIGLVNGFTYPPAITDDPLIIKDYADSTESSLKKLQSGRLDAVVADGYTAVKAMADLQIKGIDYDLSKTLHSQTAYIAFQPTGEGQALADRLTRAMRAMREDGTYHQLVPMTE